MAPTDLQVIYQDVCMLIWLVYTMEKGLLRRDGRSRRTISRELVRHGGEVEGSLLDALGNGIAADGGCLDAGDLERRR